jgi:non-canonical purine NTP pyrophosphatase (RdgB/HAM1 family)
MTLYFITGNKNKLAEVQSILPKVKGIQLDLPEIQSLDAKKVIAAKLDEASKVRDGPFIVEDTSLSLDCLNGLPGTFIKFFLQQLRREGLAELADMKGNWGAEAKTCIGYLANKNAEPQFFEGTLRGTITMPKIDSPFGWDPIFVPEGQEKCFAEMTPEEKNAISMRRIAVEKLANYLEDEKATFLLEK